MGLSATDRAAKSDTLVLVFVEDWLSLPLYKHDIQLNMGVF